MKKQKQKTVLFADYTYIRKANVNKNFIIFKLHTCVITFIFILTYNVLVTNFFYIPILPTYLLRYIFHTYVNFTAYILQ